MAVVLTLLALVVGLAVWQRDNIKAVWLFLATDEETVAQQMEAQRQEHQAALEQYATITVRPPSREESDALLDGTMSPEEVKEQMGVTPPAPPERPELPEEAPPALEEPTQDPPEEAPEDTPVAEELPETPAEPQKTVEELVNDCVAELYARKADLMAELGVLKQETLELWRSLPSGQRTPEKKRELAMEGLSKCYDLEAIIDEDVDQILDKYRVQVKALGGDTTIFDTLWEYYCDEKATEKAYYMNKYL